MTLHGERTRPGLRVKVKLAAGRAGASVIRVQIDQRVRTTRDADAGEVRAEERKRKGTRGASGASRAGICLHLLHLLPVASRTRTRDVGSHSEHASGGRVERS